MIEHVQTEGAVQRASRMPVLIGTCYRAMVRATTELDLLERVCQAIVDTGCYDLAWVGYPLLDAAHTVHPVVCRGDDSGLFAGSTVSRADAADSDGPTVTAIRTGLPCVVQNLHAAQADAPWQRTARAFGAAAVLSLPLVCEETSIGALTIYAREPDAFDMAETALLIPLANDLAYRVLALRRHSEDEQTDVTVSTSAEAALRASEERLRTVVTQTPVILFALDRTGVITFAEGWGLTSLGLSSECIVGRSVFELYHQELTILDHARRALAGESYTVTTVQAGLVFQVRWTPQHDDRGHVSGAIGVATDITERIQAGRRQTESEQRYRSLFAHHSDGVVAFDLTGRIISANRACETITGYSVEELLRRGTLPEVEPGSREQLARYFAQILSEGQPLHAEHAIIHKEGRRVELELTMVPVIVDGAVIGVYVIGKDITAYKQALSALSHQAMHDPLTDLPNRALLHDRLVHALLVARRDQVPMALLLLDCDRFKEINDTFGHHHGDCLLQQIAQRLRAALRASDTIARLGGDEFAILLPGADRDGALATVHKLSAALDEPFVVADQPLHVGVSIGVVLAPHHGPDADSALRRADIAMYTAKRAHQTYVVYEPEQDGFTPARLALVTDLRQSIAQGEFVLHYQPILELRTQQVRRVEALVRWLHPQRGLLAPDQFIPLAEETGLINALTHLVLRAALQQYHTWSRERRPLGINVNLSALNLRDPQLVAMVTDLLAEYDVAPGDLRLEVTESALIADIMQTQQVLAELAALGVGIAIDDYGTGHSSLAYLKRLPIDTLKIDKSFVQQMRENESDATIVASTIGLGHNLGMRVVAEGVEDAFTLETLDALGCDAVQGYHMSRPLPPPDLERWLGEFRRRTGFTSSL